MGLRETAAADALAILTDDDGFAWPITVIDPNGTEVETKGFTQDIHTLIDPETGVPVSGRTVTACVHTSVLDDAGVGMPRGIADESGKPWRVRFDDDRGHAHTFKVREAQPDRAGANLVMLTLEAYKESGDS